MRAFGNELRPFGAVRAAARRRGTFEVAKQALRGKLNRRKGILDFVSDALRDLLPGGGFLSAEEFGEVVDDDDESRIAAARAERADGDGGVMKLASARDFEFLGSDAHAERAAHELEDAAGGVFAQKLGERSGRGSAVAEHSRGGGVDAVERAAGVERQDAGGNVFEDGFHQFAAALDFFEGLLKALCELVNAFARFAELRGHLIEGADQGAQLIMGVRGDAILEVAACDLLGGLDESLNRDGDALGEEQRYPGGGEEEQQRNQEQAEQDLVLKETQMLILRRVGARLGLDTAKARDEILRNAASDHEPAARIRSAAREVQFAANLPDVRAAGKILNLAERRAGRKRGCAGGFGAGFVDAPHDVKLGIGPRGIAAKTALASRSGKPRNNISSKTVEALVFLVSHLGDQFAALLIGNFERLGKPDGHGAVDKRVTEE